jgi:hypothetical protein
VGVDHLMDVGALVLGERPLESHLIPRPEEPVQHPAQPAATPAWCGHRPVVLLTGRHGQSSPERLCAVLVHLLKAQVGQRLTWPRFVRGPQQVDQSPNRIAGLRRRQETRHLVVQVGGCSRSGCSRSGRGSPCSCGRPPRARASDWAARGASSGARRHAPTASRPATGPARVRERIHCRKELG